MLQTAEYSQCCTTHIAVQRADLVDDLLTLHNGIIKCSREGRSYAVYHTPCIIMNGGSMSCLVAVRSTLHAILTDMSAGASLGLIDFCSETYLPLHQHHINGHYPPAAQSQMMIIH